jgi:hypothetical protein
VASLGDRAAPSFRFFHIALFFTVMHVAALTAAAAPPGAAVTAAVAYLGVISLSAAALRWGP